MYESITSDVLPVILSAPSTLHMVILTVTELIWLYPVHASNSHWLICSDSKDFLKCRFLTAKEHQFFRKLFRLTHSNTGFTSPCRSDCPIMWKRTTDGIGICRWDGPLEHMCSSYAFSDTILSSGVSWNIASICTNSWCETPGVRF